MSPTYICLELASSAAADPDGGRLTSRENQVLRLVARDHCNKAIARQLEIAEGTVKTHVKAIHGKLNASSRTEGSQHRGRKRDG